jgi:hypothetical protein
MPREIATHKVNGCNEALKVEALDAPGPGGACAIYRVRGFRDQDRPEFDAEPLDICFQNRPVAEVGPNGVTHEALLAVLIDRLQGFQKGPYACRENAIALTKLEEAMLWLHKRTRDRAARGVEGTHAKWQATNPARGFKREGRELCRT